MTGRFPDWSEDLEEQLWEVFHSAPPRRADGGSRHGGMEAVYLHFRNNLLGDGPDSQDNQDRA